MEHQDNLRAAALFYARKGWPVFPVYEERNGECACGNPDCGSPAKHPRTRNGFKDATTDQQTIEMCWGKWPEANIGIATGNGLVVIDVDTYHDGYDSLEELRGENDLPETVEALTGGGGRHMLFTIESDLKVASKVGIMEGIDIRANGGYVVVPPSKHISGKLYEWELSSRPDMVEVAPMPSWLMKVIGVDLANNGKIRINESAGPIPDVIPEGQRHSHLLSMAGTMRHRGATEDEVFYAIQSFNTNRCNPPLKDKELRELAVDVTVRYPPGSVPHLVTNEKTPIPPPLKKVLPFPVEVLPKPLRYFVIEAAASLPAPPDFVAVPMLSVLGTGVGTRRSLELKPGWQESVRYVSSKMRHFF